MVHSYQRAESEINLWVNEPNIQKNHYKGSKGNKHYALIWNTGDNHSILVDGIEYVFPQNTVLPIMLNQSYELIDGSDMVCWQFNKEFYCIATNDAEVSCIGFLFYGLQPVMFIDAINESAKELQQLKETFVREFITNEDIKGEMLRTLLVTLIINVTRWAKKQYLGAGIDDEKFNLLRQYSILVDHSFRQEKQVQFYAEKLNMSPKNMAHVFNKYSKTTPLQVIQERTIQEAKRLLLYTDKSIKEIAFELGYEDASHFAKFFKKQTTQSPLSHRKAIK